jgi:SAM-dependent methyltransferase
MERIRMKRAVARFLRLIKGIRAGFMFKKTAVFQNPGFCYCCNQTTRFTASSDWWRDDYKCDKCGSIPRERAIMFSIVKFFPEWSRMVIHESSPGLRGTSVRLAKEAEHYIASQYYPDVQAGKIMNGYRNENLEALSFADNSIDIHVTQDVFEHILDPEKAFKEIARTLKPGGAHIFTTPLVKKTLPTEWRARRKKDGSIEYLIEPPEYHGNPISTDGSLVTVHWGYDITKHIFDASGLFTEIVYIDALEFGIRAELIEVLITRKPL